MYETLAMYIDGQWCQGGDGKSEDVLNPAIEVERHRVHALEMTVGADDADVDRAHVIPLEERLKVGMVLEDVGVGIDLEDRFIGRSDLIHHRGRRRDQRASQDKG